jgi:tRNA G18 (ribose-2'-O)-methylase SpoU
MTDKYLDVFHHATVDDFKTAVASRQIVGFEDTENAQDLNSTSLPKSCVLLFGNEGLGLSDEALAVCDMVVAIPQFGSVRSINASAAGAIGMFEWMRQHVLPGAP